MFLPNRLEKISKNNKKIQKIQLWHNFQPKQVGKGREREKIKIIAPFRFFSTGKGKFQKNSNKIQKIEKYHYGFIPSQNKLENAEKERK